MKVFQGGASSPVASRGAMDRIFLPALRAMGVGLAHVCHRLTHLTRESDEAARQAQAISEASVSITSMAHAVVSLLAARAIATSISWPASDWMPA